MTLTSAYGMDAIQAGNNPKKVFIKVGEVGVAELFGTRENGYIANIGPFTDFNRRSLEDCLAWVAAEIKPGDMRIFRAMYDGPIQAPSIFPREHDIFQDDVTPAMEAWMEHRRRELKRDKVAA